MAKVGEPAATRFAAVPVAAGQKRPRWIELDSPATYLNWNFILISIPNVLMIAGMIAVFVVALIAPFPSHREIVASEEDQDA